MNTIKIFFVNLLNEFPKNPFSFDSYVDSLDSLLPVLNWFIPFYKLAPIFHIWLNLLFVSIMVYLVFRFIKKGFLHD